jgi:hypothetical protein
MIRLPSPMCRVGKPDFTPECPSNKLLVWDARTAISLSADTIESSNQPDVIIRYQIKKEIAFSTSNPETNMPNHGPNRKPPTRFEFGIALIRRKR